MGKEFGVGECYLCNRKFDNKTVKKHEEHIIHNALGGQLTSETILCENCGNILNEKIDKKFLKLFENIYGRLNLRKDRDKKIKLVGKWRDIEVIYEKNYVYPRKPFYFEKTDYIEVYCNKKIFKNYKKKFNNYKKKIYYKIIPLEEVNFDIKVDRNKEEYKLGLLKIAVEFLMDRQVRISNLERIRKILLNEIDNDIEIVHFLPLGIIDKFIELQKEDLFPYPFHKIIVFNIYRKLVVYIELFSTFQEFIILDSDYKGKNIFECFMQKILKEEVNKIDIDYRRYYKERNLYFEPLGISLEEVELRYKKYKQFCKNDCLSREKWEWKLIQEENRKRKYFVDCYDYIQNAIGRVNNQFLLFSSVFNNEDFTYQRKNLYFNELVVKNLKQLNNNKFKSYWNFHCNLSLFYKVLEKYGMQEEQFVPYTYRKLFIKSNKIYFYPFVCKNVKLKMYQDNYYNFKLDKLEEYIKSQYNENK